MKFNKWKNENISAWYYDIGFRKEFKITYKLPTWIDFKKWWINLWKKKSKK